MTREEWSKLSDSEKNMVIAGLCGWTSIRKLSVPYGRPPGTTDRYVPLPNYLEDLNAMHEAERIILEKELWFPWVGMLCYVANDHSPYMASATQRAEAFALTMLDVTQ